MAFRTSKQLICLKKALQTKFKDENGFMNDAIIKFLKNKRDLLQKKARPPKAQTYLFEVDDNGELSFDVEVQ